MCRCVCNDELCVAEVKASVAPRPACQRRCEHRIPKDTDGREDVTMSHARCQKLAVRVSAPHKPRLCMCVCVV